MKSLILSSMALVFAIFTSTVNAQQQHPDHEKNNYVILTKKVEQLKPIILTAKALTKEDGDNFGDFQAIVCGKDIVQLTDKEKMDSFMKQAEEAGVKIVACGFSLNKFKVDRKDIPQEMEVVENGILYDFQLQKKGYYSLGL